MSIDDLQKELAESFTSPTTDRTISLCKKYGFEALGLGGQRIAVAWGEDQVAKLAWRKEGLVNNEIEWRLYSQAPKALQKLLCPSDQLLPCGALLQKRCLPSADCDPKIIKELISWGISDAAVNMGFRDGSLVCYDYCFLSPSRLREIISNEKDPPLSLDNLN
jgi:hypothetical protein